MHETVHHDTRRGADFSHVARDARTRAIDGDEDQDQDRARSDTKTYVLQNVTPISRTETTTPSGTTVSTTYALVPERTVELQQSVGRRVEVTGVLIEAGHGDAKITQRTKTDGKEEKTTTEVERGPLPQLRVLSVKPAGGTC
jgi:hypothetical protein